MSLSKLVPASGPKNAKIVIVGEAPGEQEEINNLPFVGQSGKLLTSMLEQAGIKRHECYLTNVLKTRPPKNDLRALCADKKSVGASYRYPPLIGGKYLRPEFLPQIEAFREELQTLSPNITILLGNTALWAMGLAKISQSRGYVYELGGRKYLPTYHPAAVLRQWDLRAVVVMDLLKAQRESLYPEVRRPNRELWIEPTLEEVEEFFSLYLDSAPEITYDVETKRKQITCIGFAPGPERAICIPLWDNRAPDLCYWDRPSERAVMHRIRGLFRRRNCNFVAQNGMYDIQYLARHGIKLRKPGDDTMLLHHSLYPELPKGLGFLSSIYTNELSHKHMVKDFGKDK